jgi:hypothetical protein
VAGRIAARHAPLVPPLHAARSVDRSATAPWAVGAFDDPSEAQAERSADLAIAGRPEVARPIGLRSAASRDDLVCAPPSVHAALASGGTALAAGVRRDMEQRFGWDFAHVRVHADAAGARSASELRAHAYTAGEHIVFGAGRYAPSSADGRRLLAHELAHVVQHGAGATPARVLRRAPVDYRALTWQDFQGTAKETDPESAGILSRFEFPSFTSVSDTTNTKRKCGRGRDAPTDFKVTKELDPAQADNIKAVMDPAASWLKLRFKDDGTKECTKQADQCKRDFDSSAASVAASCETMVKGCEDSFKTSKGERAFRIGDKRLILRTPEQCRPMLVDPCRKDLLKDAATRQGTRVARTKDDCTKGFFTQCKADEKVQKDRLLEHEQGHFDITNELAKRVRPEAKAKAATVKVAATKCGEALAAQAATEAYDRLYAEFKDLLDAWTATKERAQTDYDTQTGHGVNMAQQKSWETRIKAGLKGYAPIAATGNAPAATSVPAQPSGTPAATPPVTRPAQPSGAPR